MTPQEALHEIAKAGENSILVDTHCHAHLERALHESYQLKEGGSAAQVNRSISLSCSVEPSDWRACLNYASQSTNILPGLGVHPWYLDNLPEDYLQTLENLLQEHPTAMVGEIGLCKRAKFLRTYSEGKAAALELQRSVFTNQLKLAAKYKRPVTVHCVAEHASLMRVLGELKVGELPPTIAMHSFSGSAHHVQQLLKFEKHIKFSTTIYFGFSHIVNFEMNDSEKSRRQGIEAIRAVPADRLLAESDVSTSADVAAGTAGAIAYLAYALEKPIAEVAKQTAVNGVRFLTSPLAVSADS